MHLVHKRTHLSIFRSPPISREGGAKSSTVEDLGKVIKINLERSYKIQSSNWSLPTRVGPFQFCGRILAAKKNWLHVAETKSYAWSKKVI